MPVLQFTVTIIAESHQLLFVWEEAGAGPYARTARSLERVSFDLQRRTALHEALGAAAQRTNQTMSNHVDTSIEDVETLGRLLFTQFLPEKLQTQLRQLSADTPLVMATNDLETPWELLHDGSEYLVIKRPFTRQLLTSSPPLPLPLLQHELLRVLIVGNPTGDLGAADAEVEALIDLFDSVPHRVHADSLSRQQATSTRFLTALASGSYDIIHYAGHARPGALHLADGWLETSAIQSAIARPSPGANYRTPLIFLNACASAQRSELDAGSHHEAMDAFALAGQQTHNLAGAFLQGGASAFVGTLWPILDVQAQQLAIDFYHSLVQAMPIAAALQRARRRGEQKRDGGLLWASFVLYGDPYLQLVRPGPTQHTGTVLVVAWEPMTVENTHIPPHVAHIQRRLEQVGQCIIANGGQIAAMDASQVLAVFGAPNTLEDDAKRAVQSALTILTLAQANEHVGAPAIGIASGRFTGSMLAFADNQQVIYTGNPISSAQHLAQKAQPGHICINQETHQLVGRRFRCEALPAENSKSPGYRLWPFDESVDPNGGHITDPITIGRTSEIAELQKYWQEAQSGRWQVVGIEGEAGLGKSHLLKAFQSSLAAAEYRWIAGACTPMTATTPYFVVTQLLRALWELPERDASTALEDYLTKALDDLPTLPEKALSLPILREAFGLSSSAAENLGTDERKARQSIFIKLLAAILLREASKTPLVIAIEDMHWIDDASQIVLGRIADGIGPHPLLILVTYRPEWTTDWHRKRAFRSISLNPFTQAEAVQLMQVLLQSESLPSDICEFLIERSHGNPFYMTEQIHYLLNQQILRRAEAQWQLIQPVARRQLPPTLTRIILSRLPALHTSSHRVLIAAAVLGLQVSADAVAHLVGENRQFVEDQLAMLGHDLLQPHWGRGDYQFQHVLIQETIYQSISIEERQILHRRAGDLLVQNGGEFQMNIESIAHHFYHSNDRINGVIYCLRAADHAASVWANASALRWYERAGEILAAWEMASPTAREAARGANTHQLMAWRVALLEGKADVQSAIGYNDEAIENYQLALTVLEGDPNTTVHQAGLYSKVAVAWHDKGDLARAQVYLNQAQSLLNDGHYVEYSQIIFWQSMLKFRQGYYQEALANSHQAVQLLSAAEPSFISARLSTLQGILYDRLGQPNEAIAAYEAGIALCRSLNYLPGLARGLSNLGIVYERAGNWNAALEYYEQAADINEVTGEERQSASTFLDMGEVYRRLGDLPKAHTFYQRAIEIATTRGFPEIQGMALNNQAGAYLKEGKLTEAAAALQAGESILAVHGFTMYQAELLIHQAELLLAQGQIAEAETKARAAIEQAQHQNEPAMIMQAHYLMGKILVAQGDRAAGFAALQQSLDLAVAHKNLYQIGLSLLALAQADDEPEQVRDRLNQAITYFRDMGASLDLQQAELLRQQRTTDTNG
ncbi:MAG: CHAT domain-containing protein [Caldilineaceae bacterium]